MPKNKEKNRRGIIFWSGFSLGLILAVISIWYVITAYTKTHDNAFVALALIPTFLFLIASILAIISKKAGAIYSGILFALVLASSITQGSYWVFYVIPAWLFLSGALIA